MPFAQQSGLKLDEQSGVIYGNYQGYDITILPTGGGKTFQLSFSVKRGEEAPNITEMQKLTRLYKSLFLGAVPTISNTLKKHESLGKVYRMGSYAVQSEENINI